MKIIFTICLFITGVLNGQTWQTIYGANFSPINIFTGGGGGTFGNKHFKINPYDNFIWMGFSDIIQVLRNDGTLELHSYMTNATLHQAGNMLDFEFTPSHSFVVDENFGLHKYNGSNWANVYLGSGGSHLSSDIDTVWMAKSNNTSFISTYDGFVFTGSNSFFRRIASRNGVMWVSPSSESGIIVNYSNEELAIYSPDTSMLLDNTNYDFKFAKKTDTLYVSGALGFSLAYNDAFIDTITPGNSINMPSSSIIEFEFDNQDNIWAVFGDSWFYANAIGYYDQASETWTQVYDATNSPIDFSTRISIEVDTSGNLWVANTQNLHVLKINNPPAWLSVYEQEKLETISIFPNPVSDVLSISTNGIQIENSEILDLKGNVLLTNFNSEKIEISLLEAGMYFVRFKTASGRLFQKKFIKE